MRTSAWLAWGLFAVGLALASIGGALLILTLGVPVPDNWGFRGYGDVVVPIVSIPGLLVALRHPRNPIGWLLLTCGIVSGFGGFAQEYATYALIAHPGSLPAALPIAWVASWSFIIFLALLLVFVPLLFPTGRVMSARWRPVLWAGFVFAPFGVVFFGLKPGPLENASFVENPLALSGSLEDLRVVAGTLMEPVLAVIVVLAGASLVVRYRRSKGVERQQLKWVALSAIFLVVGMIWNFLTTPVTGSNTSKPAQIAMILAFATLPISMGLAILRYRLYDIDLIINRTIVYGALSAILAGTYVALVVVSQALLRPITGGSEIAVAGSTLTVVALVQPLRRRLQDAVDRRFYRSRYDAVRTLDSLATRLRDDVDVDSVRREIVEVIAETVRPRHASVWLRGQRP